jgi:L-threonylcarbamoyladenylate synthase
MPSETIEVRDLHSRQRGLSKAASVILSGGIVAVPTESFYGLAVSAHDEKAIRRLLKVKRIEAGHPILLLIPSVEKLSEYVQSIPPIAERLIKEFWPGGLTLVMAAGPSISRLLTAGTGKIGVRLSQHPIATGLARAAGMPVTGTSANITGSRPCVSAGEVEDALGTHVDLILDGGRTEGGKGSTVLDVTTEPPRILREGMVDRARLREMGI